PSLLFLLADFPGGDHLAFFALAQSAGGAPALRSVAAAGPARRQTHSRTEYREIFPYLQHSDRERGAGTRGLAHFGRGGQQPSHEKSARGSGAAGTRGSPDRQVAGGAQAVSTHDDSPDQQRREQRRAGEDARTSRDQSGAGDGRPAF